jgi:hypothetical protein
MNRIFVLKQDRKLPGFLIIAGDERKNLIVRFDGKEEER